MVRKGWKVACQGQSAVSTVLTTISPHSPTQNFLVTELAMVSLDLVLDVALSLTLLIPSK